MATRLSVRMTVAQTIETFTEESQTALLLRLRNMLGCMPPDCSVELSILSGSLRLQVDVTLPHHFWQYWNAEPSLTSRQETIKTAVEQLSLMTTQQASSALSLEVAVAPSLSSEDVVPTYVAVSTATISGTSPSSPSAYVGQDSGPTLQSQEQTAETTVSLMAGVLIGVAFVVCCTLVSYAWFRWQRKADKPTRQQQPKMTPHAHPLTPQMGQQHPSMPDDASEWPSLVFAAPVAPAPQVRPIERGQRTLDVAESARRQAWIQYRLANGELQEARDLGWDGSHLPDTMQVVPWPELIGTPTPTVSRFAGNALNTRTPTLSRASASRAQQTWPELITRGQATSLAPRGVPSLRHDHVQRANNSSAHRAMRQFTLAELE